MKQIMTLGQSMRCPLSFNDGTYMTAVDRSHLSLVCSGNPSLSATLEVDADGRVWVRAQMNKPLGDGQITVTASFPWGNFNTVIDVTDSGTPGNPSAGSWGTFV